MTKHSIKTVQPIIKSLSFRSNYIISRCSKNTFFLLILPYLCVKHVYYNFLRRGKMFFTKKNFRFFQFFTLVPVVEWKKYFFWETYTRGLRFRLMLILYIRGLR